MAKAPPAAKVDSTAPSSEVAPPATDSAPESATPRAPLHLHPRHREIAAIGRGVVLDKRVRHEVGHPLGNIKWSLLCTSTGVELAEFESMKHGLAWCKANGYAGVLVPAMGIA